MILPRQLFHRAKGFLLIDFFQELLRCGFLLFIAYRVTFPYFTSVFFGDYDEHYYRDILADALIQYRAGHFPVFISQTEIGIGGIAAMTKAPFLFLLGTLVDLATGQSLSPTLILHIELILSVLMSLSFVYFSLRSFNKSMKWEACFLAALFVLCPGVTGVLYVRDMVYSLLGTPFAALLFAGFVRFYRREDIWSALIMGVALTFLWSAHAPTALLSMFVVGVAQLLLFLFFRRTKKTFALCALSYVIFGLLSVGLFVPIFALNAQNHAVPMDSPFSGFIPPAYVEFAVKMTNLQWPWAMRPINFAHSYEGSVQLGYSLWSLLALALLFIWKGKGQLSLLFLGACLFMSVLLYPIPVAHTWLWAHLPNVFNLLNTSSPHLRIYIVFAAVVVFLSFLSLENLLIPKRWWKKTFVLIFLAYSCRWSLKQFKHLTDLAISRQGRTSETVWQEKLERTEALLLPENTTNYPFMAYLPEEHIDPLFENKLIHMDGTPFFEPRTALTEKCRKSGIDAHIQSTLRPSHPNADLYFDRLEGYRTLLKVSVPPGKKLLLGFKSEQINLINPFVLFMNGKRFYRRYPAYVYSAFQPSGKFSFFSIEHSDTAAKEISFDFFGYCQNPDKTCHLKITELCLTEYIPGEIPIQLHSLLPYRATVDLRSPAGANPSPESPQQLLLDTNRLFLPGYIARVNGQEVRTYPTPPPDTRDRLRIPVQTGVKSSIDLRYTGTLIMRISWYWSILLWSVLCVLGIYDIASRKNRFS